MPPARCTDPHPVRIKDVGGACISGAAPHGLAGIGCYGRYFAPCNPCLPRLHRPILLGRLHHHDSTHEESRVPQ